MEKLTQKHIKRFLDIVGAFNFKTNKLGRICKIMNVDENYLNYKVKDHRGRSPVNKTDALCIVEVEEHITRAFSCFIENKKAETLIPIITDNVEEYSTEQMSMRATRNCLC
jgi:hypothetical protein